MSIFQPTNVTPSVFGPLGSGAVDPAADLTVSWQVNGNSPLTAFSVDIQQNDPLSTPVYSSGKRTDGCPFFGVNAAGDPQIFSFTIPKSALTLQPGKNYKLAVTQWWSDTQSVPQYSPSAFFTRSAPVLALDAIPSPLPVRAYTFTASYSQAQGDALNWVRWQLALSDDTENPLADTGEIYGTAQLSFPWDGLFPGQEYAVRCTVQTESGVTADTGFVPFSVAYEESSLSGFVTASCGRKNAVSVEWPLIAYAPGEGSGYDIAGNTLALSPDGQVSWETVNGSPMAFPAPWTLWYSGQLAGASVTLFTLETQRGPVTLSYDAAARSLTLQQNGSPTFLWEMVWTESALRAILTPAGLYLWRQQPAGGLYPAPDLFPGEDLFPRADDQTQTFSASAALSAQQGTVTKIALGGPQTCHFLQLSQNAPELSQLQSFLQANQIPPRDENTLLRADFSAGLEGGNLVSPGEKLVGLSVYRSEPGGVLRPLASLSLDKTGLLDYGAKSQQGPYTYYVFPVGETTFLSAPLVSNPVSPCFWDWCLLTAEKQTDGSFLVDQVFAFGKNLTSGTMSNNNSPNLLGNFTPYPLIQPSPQNYKSGVLQSLIGVIENGQYLDTLAQRDAVFALSTTQKSLFLKSRKGDLLPVGLTGPVTMETMDNTPQQAQTASLSWAQIAGEENLALVALP